MTDTSAGPTLGRIVHYTLGPADVNAINGSPATGLARGNSVRAGQVLPAVVVAAFGGSTVNLKVLLDGYENYWATSRVEGVGEYKWAWPPRV